MCLTLTHAQEGEDRATPAPTETGKLQDEQPLPPPVPSPTSDPVPAPDTFHIPTRSTTRQSPPVQTRTKQQQQQTRQRPDQLHRDSEGTRWTPETPRSEDPISLRSADHVNEEVDEREDLFEDRSEDPYRNTWPVSVERSVLLWMIVAFLIILTIIVLVLMAVVFRLRMAIECLVQKICCNKTPCCN
ncbi:hypothetical protein Pcinc_019402 [Petrolisthes cinctipes]|uniref:Uncharacterized protein n=1 Tax=Petrolisthes cinctipes TaxID=88211 RepID=A0AAE1FQ19_PETCI|nr:hypothetical protein Pcinc_019402 [Petrolisthes cinctipes]